jgi:hypothetical protein
MYCLSLFIPVNVVVLLIGTKVAAKECGSRMDCTKIEAPFCCKKYKGSFSPNVCLPTCVNRTCESDDECGGLGGECCNTVNKICTTKGKCLKACDVELKCSIGTYCCQQTGFDPQICAKSCLGKSCNFDRDCGAPGECCDDGGECTKSCSSNIPTWLIVVFVIVGVLCLFGIGFVIRRFVRSTSRRRSGSLRPLMT